MALLQKLWNYWARAAFSAACAFDNSAREFCWALSLVIRQFPRGRDFQPEGPLARVKAPVHSPRVRAA